MTNQNKNLHNCFKQMGRAVCALTLALALSGCSILVKSEETKESAPVTEGSQNTTGMDNTTEPATQPLQNPSAEVPEKKLLYKIVIATDIHYVADNLADPGGESFEMQTQLSEGQLVPYVSEILDAFIENVLIEQPDIVILSGDLTLNGARESHEELAGKLQVLLDEGIQVLVVPGNHDINNPQAMGFSGAQTYPVSQTTPQDFRSIYRDFGYDAAFSEEEDTLSYLFELNDSTWIMMLDSCQYETVCQVGGMIKDSTYDWMEPYLTQSWEESIRILPVSHHNLLEQSRVSELFVDDCTLEHDERFIAMLEDNRVPLYLSGHLHVQHFAQSDGGVYEAVTSALSVPPFQYGVVEAFDNLDIRYHTETVDVEGWAMRHRIRDENLKDFGQYAAEFFAAVSYDEAYQSLRDTEATPKQRDDMAKLFAQLNPAYYAGKAYRIREALEQDPAWELWGEYGYFSEYYDTMVNILEDEVEDYNQLLIEE